MGISVSGKYTAIAASSNFGLKGPGGIWLADSGQIIKEWSAPCAIFDCQWAIHDLYVGGSNGNLYCFNRKLILANKIEQAHQKEINRISSHKDLVATTSWDATCKIWHGPKNIATFTHDSCVNEADFNPGGSKIATASMSGPIKIWDIHKGLEQSLGGYSNVSFLTIHWSPDGRLLAFAGTDHSIHIIDSISGKSISNLAGHYRSVRQLKWKSSRELVSAGYDMSVRWWDLSSLNPLVWSDTQYTEFVVTVDVSPQETVAASWDHRLIYYSK